MKTGKLAVTLAWCGAAALVLAGVAYAADGKAVFEAQKCGMCHAVSTAGIEATTKSEKMKGPDLAGCVQAHEAGWVAKYLKKEVDIEGKKHPKEFKGTEEEFTALVAFLEAQKK
jgi:cytochrome c2